MYDDGMDADQYDSDTESFMKAFEKKKTDLSQQPEQNPAKNSDHIVSKPKYQLFVSASNLSFSNKKTKMEPITCKSRQVQTKNSDQSELSSTATLSANPLQKDVEKSCVQKQAKPSMADIQDFDQSCNSCGSKQKVFKRENEELLKKLANKKKNMIEHQIEAIKAVKPPSIKQEYKKYSQSFNPDNYVYDGGQIPRETLPSLASLTIQKSQNQRFNYVIDKQLVSGQKKIEIGKHRLYFPYEPYQSQMNYMGSVLQALDAKDNAVLESPTGTGKTLCLLAACLSWAQQRYERKKQVKSVIYLSRTHSQLAQVGKELEKTCFRPTMATFGSRDILCIKPELQELKAAQKVQACSKGVKLFVKYGRQMKGPQKYLSLQEQEKHEEDIYNNEDKQFAKLDAADMQKAKEVMCSFYQNQRKVLDKATQLFMNKIISTKQIKQLGKKHNFCPYYYPTFVKSICNLYLMPYNYILDQALIEKYKDILKDSIVIFDEAHNVSQAACEGKSFRVNKKNFEDAIKELTFLTYSRKSSELLSNVKVCYQGVIQKGISVLKEVFGRIQDFVSQQDFGKSTDSFEEDSLKKMYQARLTEMKLYELLYERVYDHERPYFLQRGLNENRLKKINEMAQRLQQLSLDLLQLSGALQETPDGVFKNMERAALFLKKCLALLTQQQTGEWKDRKLNHYRLMVSLDDKKDWQLDVVCLVPFMTFQTIEEMLPHNIIVTSGTLSPLDSWQYELGIKFPIRLANKHVIEPYQLKLRVVQGKGDTQFNFTYKNMSDNWKTIYKDLALTVTEICETVPNGVLVVAPSYKILNQLEKCFNYDSSLKNRLKKVKDYYFQKKSNLQETILKFQKSATSTGKKGGLLFCVCRGKASQGIDFPNQLCRAVIFVGIPYPSIKDPVVKQKREHLDKLKELDKNCKFSGSTWYDNCTFRSVNQAIGRVIRHVNDYGCIFMIESRFSLSGYRGKLPQWTSNSYKSMTNFNKESSYEIEAFFSEMEERFKGVNKAWKALQFESDSKQKLEIQKSQEKAVASLFQKPKNNQKVSQARLSSDRNAFTMLMQGRGKQKKKSKGFTKPQDFL